MSATVDHLGANQLVRVLQNFIDAVGNTFQLGETGRIRHIHLDWKTFVCTIELEQGDNVRNIVLHDPRSSNPGPRSGRMREFFEVEGMDHGKRTPSTLVEPLKPDLVEQDLPEASGGTFYQRALELEKQDRMEEAEALIRDSIPNLYFAITTAEMYRTRWLRLKRAGKLEAANEAREKAAHFAWFMASLATSGGEGAALSRERDEFLKTLGTGSSSATA